jgi:hypothetical protein
MSKDTEALVAEELRRIIESKGEVAGISCLADGADALFAQTVLDLGGRLIAIIPASSYRDGLPSGYHSTYDSLLARASETVALDRTESDSEAHMDASLRMLTIADELLAVWDGQPARGHGGTADVVQAAHDKNLPVTVICPDGATRD